MIDPNWLTQEAKTLHNIFQGLFYPLVTLFLVLGITLDYFRLPLGGVPAFGVLLGRAIVAILILSAFPLISNSIGDVVDAVAQKLGDLNNFDLVLKKMSEKLETMSASWVSVKEAITMIISFASFFLLYFSIYVAEAFFLFTWSILFVFSPILIALFVLPVTAGATSALFRSIIEVSLWKIVWHVLATLLWSMALTQLNAPPANVNFVTVICLNVILAGSLLLTPIVVHALAGSGFTGFTSTFERMGVGSITMSPKKIFHSTKSSVQAGVGCATKAGGKAYKSFFANKSEIN